MIPDPMTATINRPVPSASATRRRDSSTGISPVPGLGEVGELGHAAPATMAMRWRSSATVASNAFAVPTGTGSGIDQCSQPGCGSSSSWARSHTVIVNGGRSTELVERRRRRVAEVEAGTPGGGDRAGVHPLGRVGAGADRRGAGASRSTGRRRAGSGPSSRCTRTAPDRSPVGPADRAARVRRGSGGRSDGARRRSTGCARSARPPRARRGGGPAGSTAHRRASCSSCGDRSEPVS